MATKIKVSNKTDVAHNILITSNKGTIFDQSVASRETVAASKLQDARFHLDIMCDGRIDQIAKLHTFYGLCRVKQNDSWCVKWIAERYKDHLQLNLTWNILN